MSQKKDKIIWIKYHDHHWFDENISRTQILKRAKQDGYIIEEVGILLSTTKDSIIFAQHLSYDNTGKFPRKYYDSVIRVLKSDIIRLQIWELRIK